MKTLGAVLAGGQSSRFGSDKAVALYRGRSLLEHALDALSSHCASVVIVGRGPGIADWPAPGMGPMGGVAGALRHAQANGFGQVLSIPVDCLELPADLLDALQPAPAFIAEQPVIGLWPVSALEIAEELLRGDGRKSIRAFAEAIGARPVTGVDAASNINTPLDLARMTDAAP